MLDFTGYIKIKFALLRDAGITPCLLAVSFIVLATPCYGITTCTSAGRRQDVVANGVSASPGSKLTDSYCRLISPVVTLPDGRRLDAKHALFLFVTGAIPNLLNANCTPLPPWNNGSDYSNKSNFCQASYADPDGDGKLDCVITVTGSLSIYPECNNNKKEKKPTAEMVELSTNME